MVKVMKTLSKGSKGEAVSKLQLMLNALGFDCGEVDGSYGAKTVAAVKAFQEKYGLLIDGIYGKSTAAMLEDVYEKSKNKKTTPKDEEPVDSADSLETELAEIKKSLKTLTTKVTNLEKKIKGGQ